MHKDLFQFSCPCCGKQIEVDTRTGKARAVVAADAKGQKDLDQLWQAQKRDAERLGKAFDVAKDDHGKAGQQRDKQLEKAKEDARKQPDEKLRRPFDLD